MSEQVTGAQSLIRALEHAGVDTVFGIPGGAILPAYDPLELSVRNAGVPGTMQPETRKLLEDFFAPLNRQLFEFLGTDYGWR